MEALMKTQKTNSLSPDYSQKSILVVDDVQINYLLIKAILKNTGATVLWADDGFKAIDLIDSGRKIDFVLMDYNMPGMNGYETTKMIKRKRKNLPIVSQTTYTNGPQFNNIMEAYDDILLKPITSSNLYDKINKHI
jgi:CheY-like chemotaxis protein